MICLVDKPNNGETFSYLLSIRAIRLRLGLTQEALCRRTFRPDGSRPVWPSTLSKLENLRRPARLSTLGTLAAALGVTRQAIVFRPESAEQTVVWERAFTDERAALLLMEIARAERERETEQAVSVTA